ncbi:hypothetical protein N657DRAFT_668080 [Parathielavia appendiculata]|uniref:Uncharacterized protein n=1 Tax=Parathielavia appendiculata TaxID=2587402 RepID=A0AAN6Z980_9PEZI|nr:hypothetical protein N657DRAFT_668080 [Parathielavia appendiculata]
MCYKEFVAYQCGHRSIGVTRPCPLTTTGHNFPVCTLRPDKPHYAETMCSACERQLHSRWVLIPTPRAGEDDKASSERLRAITAAPLERSNKGQRETPGNVKQTATSSDDDRKIPPLFMEEVTASGEHHVAVRLPGLYVAEWQADHRPLHDAGKCTCSTSFNPQNPQAPGDELTAHDREKLRQWRELEAEEEGKKKKHDTGEIDNQVDETVKRVAEIKEMFGEFDVESEELRVNLPRLGGGTTTENQVVEFRGQGRSHGHSQGQSQGGGNGRHHRRFQSRRERASPSHRHNPPTQDYGSSQDQGQLVPMSQPTVSYSAVRGHQSYPYPYSGAPFNQAPVTGYRYPEYAQHQQPHHFTPAYPTYATAATYTDTIPYGAHPWTAEPQRTPGMPWMTQGPGPFRTSGYIYHQPPTHERYDPGSSYATTQVPVDRQLPAPEHASPVHNESDDNHQNMGKQIEAVHATHTGSQEPLSLCGLPIGAGPEGTSHMPSWQDCPLRWHASAGNLLMPNGRDAGEDGAAPISELDGTAVAVRQEGVRENSKEDVSAGGREGSRQVERDEGYGKKDADANLDMPPPPPPRPHSAAT